MVESSDTELIYPSKLRRAPWLIVGAGAVIGGAVLLAHGAPILSCVALFVLPGLLALARAGLVTRFDLRTGAVARTWFTRPLWTRSAGDVVDVAVMPASPVWGAMRYLNEPLVVSLPGKGDLIVARDIDLVVASLRERAVDAIERNRGRAPSPDEDVLDGHAR